MRALTVSAADSCTCGHYPEYDWIGPYCEKWIATDPPFCFLAGGGDAQHCPGAMQVINKSFYWTENETVCNKSTRQQPIQWTLTARLPFNYKDILQLCIYSVTILIGTFGNLLVVKYFAFGELSSHPGSRFVVVLAVIDFVSSLWIPVFVPIVEILYEAPTSYTWPFGEKACQILMFYPVLFYASSWLLVAISLERARAIYQPFASKLKKEFVFLISTSILGFSFAVELKRGLSVRHTNNLLTHIDGNVYEYSDCSHYLDTKDNLIITIATNALGVWSPMVLIAIVHILMYIKLKKQANIRQQTSTHSSNAQICSITKRFILILIVFYICYLPLTIQFTIIAYFASIKKNIISYGNAHNTALPFTNLLMFTSSCLNPIIYSKIHEKIYTSIKNFIATCGQKCLCLAGFTFCKKMSATP